MSRHPLIFIMAEQLRYDVFQVYGDRQCETPHLDEFSRQSSVFGRHYTLCPLSVPTRGTLMTGLSQRQHGAIINGWFRQERQFGTIKPDLPLLPNRLLDAGYDVIHAGIQHVRSSPDFVARCPGVQFIGPTSVGSHHRKLSKRGLMLPDMSVFRDPVLEHEAGRPTLSAGTSPRTAMFPLRENLFFDVTLANNIRETIAAHDGDKPLALFAMFWLPHPPLWAPRQWALQVAPEAVQLSGTVGRWFSGMPASQLANVPGQLGAHVPYEMWQHAWAMYFGMCSLLDHCVGMVLTALREKGLYDEATIVFTSDHGDMLGSHRLYQKMCLYEEVVRCPLFIKTPGQQNQKQITSLTDHRDLANTLCAFADLDPMPDSQGVNLRPLAEGQTDTHPRPAVFAAYDGSAGRGYQHRMVRTPTHKFIHNIGDRGELYDLIEDPRETHNLAGKTELARLENELRQMLNDWMDAEGDDQPRCDLVGAGTPMEATSAGEDDDPNESTGPGLDGDQSDDTMTG